MKYDKEVIAAAAVLVGAQQRRKAGIGVEARPAQPIDGPVARHQGGRFAVADQCIVFDARGHEGLVGKLKTERARPTVRSTLLGTTL